AEEHRDRGAEAKVPDDVERLEWIVEELTAVQDSRESRSFQKIVAEHLPPERLRGRNLRKEAVSTDVEAEAAVRNGARETGDLCVLLEDDPRNLRSRELVRRRQ